MTDWKKFIPNPGGGPRLLATIYESGNGFPDVGDHVASDGNLYKVVGYRHGGLISTHAPGVGNSIDAELVRADWDEIESDDDVFPASVAVDAPTKARGRAG